MAKYQLKAGTTSHTAEVFIQDSSSTTGAGLTGLAYNTAGLTAYYYRKGAASATSITLATMTLGTWASSGFVVVDGTNMPGCYQLGIPDAALAAGAKSVLIILKGATNMAQLALEIELTAVDNQSATAFITGVNSLAPPTNWNLQSIDANGRVDVIKIAGTTQTARDIGASVLLSSGTGTGQIDFTSGVVKANTTQFAGQTVSAAAGVTMPATVASTTNITGGTITTVTNLTNAPTSGDFTATMKTSIGTAVAASAVASVTGNVGGNIVGSVGSVASGVTVTTNNDKTGYALSSAGVTAIWAEVMTGTTTAVQAMRGFLAVLLGKASGLATTTAVYRNVADTKDVVTATVDVDGNRTAVTTDLT